MTKLLQNGNPLVSGKPALIQFRAETEEYSKIATKIGNAGSEQELNNILHSAYKIFNIKIPWKGDFDSFMGNKSNHLVFE